MKTDYAKFGLTEEDAAHFWQVQKMIAKISFMLLDEDMPTLGFSGLANLAYSLRVSSFLHWPFLYPASFINAIIAHYTEVGEQETAMGILDAKLKVQQRFGTQEIEKLVALSENDRQSKITEHFILMRTAG